MLDLKLHVKLVKYSVGDTKYKLYIGIGKDSMECDFFSVKDYKKKPDKKTIEEDAYIAHRAIMCFYVAFMEQTNNMQFIDVTYVQEE
jgi:hypothetical protein